MTDWSLPPESRRAAVAAREGDELIQVRWEEKLGVALISHPSGLSLSTPEEVERWREQLYGKLELIAQARKGRFPIVVSVDGLVIRASVAELYGRIVSTYMERFASGVARYVYKPNGVGQIITVAALKEGYRANLFTSRGEAIAHALAEQSGSKPRGGS
jgi:hypothetical protein